jgi:hypothetical protein
MRPPARQKRNTTKISSRYQKVSFKIGGIDSSKFPGHKTPICMIAKNGMPPNV